jgi:hypothetical protein
MAQQSTARKFKRVSGKRFEALLVIIKVYQDESEKCAKAEAWYAAAAMIGAALEGSLLAMCSLYPAEVTTYVAGVPALRRLHKQMDRWTLGDLIEVAVGSGWLPARDHKNGRLKIGNVVQRSQDLRNMVHPGRHVRDYPNVRITRAHYEHVADLFEAANSWLLSKLHKALSAKSGKTKRAS